MGSSLRTVQRVLRGADCLEREEQGHTRRGREEQEAATPTVDLEGREHGPEKVPDGEDTSDEELDIRVGDANGVEDLVEVVGHETVARPLREPGDGDDDPNAPAVTMAGNESLPSHTVLCCIHQRRISELLFLGRGRSILTFQVHLNGCLDLLELVEHERVALIAVRVIVCENVKRLGLLALADKPTRRLGNEPDQEELEEGRDGLKDRRDTP